MVKGNKKPPGKKKKKIMFVCTANICRSVMAEHLFKKLTDGRRDLEIRSGGVETAPHYRIEGPLTEIMRQFGVDARRHRGAPVTAKMLEESDYVVVMEKRHREILKRLSPRSAPKIFLIKEFAGQEEDFDDPIHTPAPDFRAIGREMERYLRKFIEHLNRGTPY